MPELDWNATINAIRETLPQAQFQNWFKPLRLIRCDDRSVVVGVPNRFHEEWVKHHYSEKLSEAIRNQCGTELQLEFEILLREENHEASQSHLPPPPAPSARPSLRVVSTDPDEIGALSASPAAPQEPAPRPSFPSFPDPFLEFEFNSVAVQCANLFVAGQELALNPLILLGGVGMGKTHLLAEIGTKLHARSPRARIRYVTAENFTNEFVQSFKSGDTYLLKKRYAEETDCLLFDGIHGLSKRLKTQEELLHVFNEITSRGGKICFTTTVAPHLLEGFIEPLRSRILAGVVAEIRPPTFEQKVELLGKKCARDQINMDSTVLRSLAAQGHNDVRELLGAVVRLHLQARLENRQVDHEFLARKAWPQEARKETLTLEEIISLVEHNFGVRRADLVSKSRKGCIAWARQVAMYLARHYTMLSLEEIGKHFGRDHATVIHAFQKVKEIMESQPTRRYEVEFLEEKISSRSFRNPEE